jgi:large subunit ribosomal protein L13
MLKPTHYTKAVKESEIKRRAHLVDAKNQKLGRLASQIAIKLIGKDKVNYTPNLDMGDYVVVINAGKLSLDQRKINSKEYSRYSGYQSGRKTIPLSVLWPQKADRVIKLAVKGMLPDNKLKKSRLQRLFVFRYEEYSLPPQVKKLIAK